MSISAHRLRVLFSLKFDWFISIWRLLRYLFLKKFPQDLQALAHHLLVLHVPDDRDCIPSDHRHEHSLLPLHTQSAAYAGCLGRSYFFDMQSHFWRKRRKQPVDPCHRKHWTFLSFQEWAGCDQSSQPLGFCCPRICTETEVQSVEGNIQWIPYFLHSSPFCQQFLDSEGNLILSLMTALANTLPFLWYLLPDCGSLSASCQEVEGWTESCFSEVKSVGL